MTAQEQDIEAAAARAARRARPITVVLTGAGISTESGIPDFRSPGGVWDRFDPMEFTIQHFHADPIGFWDRRARLIAAMDYLDAEPNEAHHILARAAEEDRVHRVITQNVDGLHAKAGTPPQRLLEVHGNGSRVVCMQCGRRDDARAFLARRAKGASPDCLACGGLVKPDVVLFGEPVPRMAEAQAAVSRADRLIVVGTSLVVHPVAGLVPLAAAHDAEIIILNREETPYDELAAHVDHGPLAETLQRFLP